MTEPRYTHVVCGQCAQWHPIGPCPAPPAMTDDELARALLETLTRRPNGFHDGLQVSEERAIQLIVAYGREERRRAIGEQRIFPMQDGPNIPWSLAETIYRIYSAVFGTQQSLERLAERGGFGWAEIPLFIKEHQRRFGLAATNAIIKEQTSEEERR